MREKEYKTYHQLLTILRSRGMIIEKGSQGSRVMRILEEENYYNVINGYKDL
jgi:abortive infection bacteriophage resistance protein